MKDKAKLWKLCADFVTEHEISCAEKVYDSDRIIEDAYEFINQICDIIGYHEYGDDE